MKGDKEMLKALEIKIIDIVKEQAGTKNGPVKLKSNFIDDLNMDSLDLVELVMSLEEEYCLEIEDKDMEKLLTSKDVIDYIANKKKIK